MSRIGKLTIQLPANVRFMYNDSIVTVEGPKGKLEKTVKFSGKILTEDNTLKLVSDKTDKKSKALYGLTRSLINSMVVGVTEGYSNTLKIIGVGYKAQLRGKALVLNLGFSHVIQFNIPDGIKIEVPDSNSVVVSGIDKQLVGQVAADIRRLRLPEPYKGKGITYSNEKIRRKASKAGIK